MPFESHEEGMAELEPNMHQYHAVILDAKVKLTQGDVVTNLKGLRASRDRLIAINESGLYLPYFIFTGQPDYTSNEDFRDSFGEFYVKARDNQKLFDDIKEKVTNSEVYVIQSSYPDVFRICDEYFDASVKKTLTEILVGIKNPKAVFNDGVYFTQVRLILESLFRVANKKGLLHDACLPNGKVNLTESSLFLSGLETKYLKVKCTVPHFSKIIADNVKNILFVTGAASHTNEPGVDNKRNFQAHKRMVNTPYLLYGLTFQLMDILVWFDSYLMTKGDIEQNKSLWASMVK